eukprot:403372125
MEQTQTHYAVCVLNPDGGSGVSGVVKFIQTVGSRVVIEARIKGLTPGKHGFHVHEWGNLTNGCVTAGAHFNPTKVTHAGPDDEVRHVGDLGNVEADQDGNAVFLLEDRLINIYGDVNNVVGRAVVCHQKEDDLGRGNDEESLKTGNAGPRQACGVIGLSGPLEITKL